MRKTTNGFPLLPFSNHQNNFGFEIRKLGEFMKGEEAALIEKPHRLDFYLILFISQGHGQHIINFHSFDYRPGSILFIAKNQVHAFNVNGGSDG